MDLGMTDARQRFYCSDEDGKWLVLPGGSFVSLFLLGLGGPL